MVREIVVVLVNAPDIPVTVMVAVPVVAVVLALSVKVLVPVVLVGLNAAVTPLGRLEADKVTLPLKPLSGFMVMALEPLPPCVTVKLFGDAESVKFGGGLTVRESVVELVKLPAVPAMVTVAAPIVALLLAVRVNVLVPVVLMGLNDAVTPAGRPEADRLTLLLKRFWGFIVIVLAPLAP